MSTAARFVWFAALLIVCRADAAATRARELQNVLRATPDLVAGEQIYTSACAACHGVDGAGQPDGWAPRLAGQRPSVLATQLVDYRLGVRWDDRMQAQAADHRLASVQQLADVIGYAARLPGGVQGHGSGDALEAGARLYAGRCRGCHGAAAEGGERQRVPRLAGQNFSYLVRQIHDFVEGRRRNAERDHSRVLEALDRDEIMTLADYLSRL